MRRTGLLLALLVVSVFAASPRAAHADTSVGVNLFFDNLAPYGDWFEMENYGWVWTPRNVASDWRPYTRGQWVFSQDDGWLWNSDEEFGWATCHYGRWFFDDRYGWVWVPGNDWAPAWVAWRFGGGYVGWAPMPPQFRWNAGIGFRAGSFDFDTWIAPRQYVFVPENHFVDSRVYRQVVSPARNWTIVDATRNVTNYGVRQNRLVNRSLSVEDVEGHVGHAVPRVRVVEEPRTPPRRAEVKAGTVRVFRPPVRIDPTARPRSARVSTEVARAKPHPVEPPSDPRAARRPERPPTVSPNVAQGHKPAATYGNVKPTPTDPRRQPAAENRAAIERRDAELAQERQRQAQKLEADRQRQEQQARERRDQLQATQERQQQALKTRQAQQEQQLRQKQRDQQEREARERQGQRQAQLQRQQEEQRLKLQQQHERDHQALQGKQARQQQQLQEKQKKQQAQAEEAKRKQQQREEHKKPPAAKAQSSPPSS